MKLTFWGAARAVTGSCHRLDCGGRTLLVDCGLQQGRDELDSNRIPFSAAEVDYVAVTHAHIDHSGRLPLLVKSGFHGRIITTRLTFELMQIMLRDSAHIQESNAEYESRKGKRAGHEPVEPLYTLQDVEDTLALVTPVEYGDMVELDGGLRLRFTDAGHLLGSAYVEVWAEESGVKKKLVFSGDIGNIDQPIIRDPQPITEADYVIMESTYGDRNHSSVEVDYTDDLAAILDRTFARGGTVVIPAFAVGRTQELLYFFRTIKERGLVRSLPNFPVYLDSPLAKAATQIYMGDLSGYLDAEALELVENGRRILTFPGLYLCESTDDSRALNSNTDPKVIISASGMCDAGRIRHHLKHNLWRPECSVVFVGYQAEGSVGRRILEMSAAGGHGCVKILGEEIAVRAEIVNFPGLSSHAGLDELVRWAEGFSPRPKEVFVVHGDADVAPAFAERLRGLGLSAHAPRFSEVYDLAACRVEREGRTPRKTAKVRGDTPVYRRLVSLGQNLVDLIAKKRGLANKELAKFADQLQSLIDRWSD